MGKCKGCNANGSHMKLLNVCSECEVKVYINELLHYASYHYTTNTRDTIKKVIQEKFDHQDIIEAKQLLSDLGVEIEKTDGRRISSNRSALEADVLDLMDGLQSLDQMQDLKPKFTALDWNKVPKVSPEEAGNTVFGN